MKKYIIVIFIVFGLSTFVNAFEIGDYVCTNKQFLTLSVSKNPLCGFIVAINNSIDDSTEKILTLHTGEKISTFWIDKNYSSSFKICKCDCCQNNQHIFIPGFDINKLKDTGIEKLIGKTIHRTKPAICDTPTEHDRSYMSEPRKLLAVTDKYLILSSDILSSRQFEIERNTWDDGNWEEYVKPKRLTVTEIINERCNTSAWDTSKYNCVRCGKRLHCSWGGFNYYCALCKTGFIIKEE